MTPRTCATVSPCAPKGGEHAEVSAQMRQRHTIPPDVLLREQPQPSVGVPTELVTVHRVQSGEGPPRGFPEQVVRTALEHQGVRTPARSWSVRRPSASRGNSRTGAWREPLRTYAVPSMRVRRRRPPAPASVSGQLVLQGVRAVSDRQGRSTPAAVPVDRPSSPASGSCPNAVPGSRRRYGPVPRRRGVRSGGAAEDSDGASPRPARRGPGLG